MKIGFIGAGNMASAILSGLALKKEHTLYAYDIDKSKEKVMAEIGVNFCSKEKLLEESTVVVLAIKPFHYQDFIINNKTKLTDKLVISIAAGITDKFLSQLLGHQNYVRVMPNTPALIGKGVSAICENQALNADQYQIAESIFSSVGSVEHLKNETFDAIIPLTGSSPAYTFMYIDELIKVGLEQGIEYQTAKRLACEAVIGAASLFMSQDESADLLVDRVCSKGGTTIEGVKSLREDHFATIVNKALNKCLSRAKEMNEENDSTL